MEVRLVTFCDDIKASAAYEGVCLRQRSSQSARHSVTSAPVGISFFTTFMPLSDMSRTQQEAIFEECMKDIDDLDSKQFPL